MLPENLVESSTLISSHLLSDNEAPPVSSFSIINSPEQISLAQAEQINPVIASKIKSLELSLEKDSYKCYLYWLYILIGVTILFIAYTIYTALARWPVFGYLGILGLINILNCSLTIIGIKKKSYSVANTAAGLIIVFMLVLLGLVLLINLLHLGSRSLIFTIEKWLWAGFFWASFALPTAWQTRNILEEVLELKDRVYFQNRERLGLPVDSYEY